MFYSTFIQNKETIISYLKGKRNTVCYYYAKINILYITPITLGSQTISEPSHEIMELYLLHKLILQMLMRSQPVGLDV